MLYLLIAVVIFLLGIFLIGKFNKKLKLYKDDEGRIGFIIAAGIYALFWPFAVGLSVLAVSAYLIIAGSLKLIKKAEG